MNRVDVFFTIDKGEATADLAALRAELLARHVTRPAPGGRRAGGAPRRATPPTTRAVRRRPRAGSSAAAMLYEAMIAEASCPGATGAFLVWGDPALYDGTLPLLRGSPSVPTTSCGSCRSPGSAASPPWPPRTGWS